MVKMMPYLKGKDDPSRETYSDHSGNWTTSTDYAYGGLCSTLEVTGQNPFLQLARWRSFELSEPDCYDGGIMCTDTVLGTSYIVHIHRHQEDFWGAKDEDLTPISDAEMATFEILDSTTQQELVISVEREIMPNMRRRPCVEDPSYSRSMCWRKCFFDSLNCSIFQEGDGKNDKPRCKAIDIKWYQTAFRDFTVVPTDEIDKQMQYKYPCSCPRPCLMDRFNLYIRPSNIKSGIHYILLGLSFAPVMRIIETTVTYDIIDLMADIGGFLGLFVGYSILSVFDDIKALAMQFLRKRTSKVNVPSENTRRDMAKGFNVTGDASPEPAEVVYVSEIRTA